MLTLVKNNNVDIFCTLLPGRYTSAVDVPPLYNAVYEYWKKTWSEFFEKAGSPPGALNIENFMRHSYLIVLHTRDNEIVGTLLSSVFHLQAATTYDHPCIKPFPPHVLNGLKARGRGLCLTGEYLSVARNFRRELMGLSMADVLIGILMEIFRNQKMEMALAATVRSANVHLICKEYGYEELGSYMKIGVDCIMLTNTQESRCEHPNPRVARMVKRCWDERHDETGLTITAPAEISRKAA